MPGSTPLRKWLELLHSGTDEVTASEAWRAITPSELRHECLAAFSQGDTTLLELWRRLAVSEPREFLEYLYTDSSEYYRSDPQRAVDPLRMYGALTGMVSGALAVQAAAAGRPRESCRWLAESVEGWGGPHATPPDDLSVRSSSPEELLLACRRRLWPDPRGVGPAWAWIESLLRAWRFARERQAGQAAHPAEDPPLAECRAPILIYVPSGEGLLGALHLEARREGCGDFYPDPETMALLPMSRDFLGGADSAWAAACRSLRSPLAAVDFRWRMECPAWRDAPAPVLEGASHSATLLTALALLFRGDSWDPDCALTAETDDQGRFSPVQGVGQKVLAAFRLQDARGRSSVSRVVVHPRNGEEARAAAAQAGRDPLTSVFEASSVQEAAPQASLLARLCRLMEGEVQFLLGEATQRLGRPFTQWPALRSFCLPVRVSRDGSSRSSEAGESGAGWEDGGYGGAEIDWEQARRDLRQAVLLGPPGGGKTMLLWHEVGARCSEALQQLRQGRTQVRALELALFFRAADLARELPRSLEEQGGVARAVAEVAGSRHGLGPGPISFLQRLVVEGRCLVAMDALDEVASEPRARLSEAVGQLLQRHPECRLLLSARREGYARSAFPVPAQCEYEIRPFNDRQVETGFAHWFSDDPETGRNLWRVVRSNARLRYALRSPLLLRIACQVAADARREAAPLPRWARRIDLYETFLAELVRQWARRDASITLGQRELLLDFASDVALAYFRQRRSGAEPNVALAVNRTQRDYPALGGRPLLDDLCRAGFLMNAGVDRFDPLLTFSHATFGEYLAARSLARQVNEHGWHLVQAEIDRSAHLPEWHEVLIFLAGRLQDPTPLLKLLADPHKDDELRHRLALAAQCLPEVFVEAADQDAA